MLTFPTVVTIWSGVALAAYVGRGYAGAIVYIPAILGALLVNCLPSENKIGLLFSYWVSSEFCIPSLIMDDFFHTFNQSMRSHRLQYSWVG